MREIEESIDLLISENKSQSLLIVELLNRINQLENIIHSLSNVDFNNIDSVKNCINELKNKYESIK